MEHFSWTQFIPGVDHSNIHVATLAIVTLLITFLSVLGFIAIKRAGDDPAPADKFSIKAVFELLVEFVVDLSDKVLGHHHRGMVPLFGSIFVCILINNLVGQLPGMTPATDNFNTTYALGVFSFFTYNIIGLKEGGLDYLKHFMGPLLWLAPLMVVIEVISHLIRPLSLGMRLMANMKADHTVMGIALNLAPYGVPVLAYVLGIFVCLIQAFVFTILSMAYVSLATAHDH